MPLSGEEKDSHEVSLILRRGNTFWMGDKDELYCIANNRLNDAGDVLFVPVQADLKRKILRLIVTKQSSAPGLTSSNRFI